MLKPLCKEEELPWAEGGTCTLGVHSEAGQTAEGRGTAAAAWAGCYRPVLPALVKTALPSRGQWDLPARFYSKE